jgi:uridine kinase
MSSDNSTILVLIGGGHASGKESGANILVQQLNVKFKDNKLNLRTINMKSYMSEIEPTKGSRLPSQFDFVQIKKDLEIAVASNDYDVIILFGLYALFDSAIVNMATIRIFIDCDSDVRLGRWIKKDVLVNIYDGKYEHEIKAIKNKEKDQLEQLLNVYLNYSRHEMKMYIQDTKEKADVILPRGADIVGFTLIVDGLQSLLLKKLQQNTLMMASTSNSSTNFEVNRSYSTSSLNRDAVIQNIKNLSHEPSVMSLTNDNFSNKNKIFYDLN